MKINQTTTNPLGVFGKPTKIVVGGTVLPSARADVFYNLFDKLSHIVKSIKLSRINGVVSAYIEVYSPDEQRAQLKNVFNIDIENHCTKTACMDCEYFDHVRLTELNKNCPFFELKEKALNDGYAGILYDLILGGE